LEEKRQLFKNNEERYKNMIINRKELIKFHKNVIQKLEKEIKEYQIEAKKNHAQIEAYDRLI